ncbi:hypothetical protein GE107_14350 [Cohnella sp. CFH 77786]|uniref:hypothetical protein n=1 Tax=Cohnella sp. CFH 77786 TaxID=2662265 RepID=UPI001C60AFE0|nr:hypothetical protein [Cohnella sp. CFH 77786]MBW5447234.1 hypothetical protein [Cohnella sp. CFH 77786]
MNAKRMIMAGTVAATITIGGGLWTDGTSAASPAATSFSVQAPSANSAATAETKRKKDGFLERLGKSSDDELYEALYAGQSLADIASEAGKDVQAVIDLQVAELTEQLDARLASGMLSAQAYEAQKAELPEIVARSVYGQV